MRTIKIPYNLQGDILQLRKKSNDEFSTSLLKNDLKIMFDDFELFPYDNYTSVVNEFNDIIFDEYNLNKRQICKKLYSSINNKLDIGGMWPYSRDIISIIDWIKIYNELYFIVHKIEHSNLKKLNLL